MGKSENYEGRRETGCWEVGIWREGEGNSLPLTVRSGRDSHAKNGVV